MLPYFRSLHLYQSNQVICDSLTPSTFATIPLGLDYNTPLYQILYYRLSQFCIFFLGTIPDFTLQLVWKKLIHVPHNSMLSLIWNLRLHRSVCLTIIFLCFWLSYILLHWQILKILISWSTITVLNVCSLPLSYCFFHFLSPHFQTPSFSKSLLETYCLLGCLNNMWICLISLPSSSISLLVEQFRCRFNLSWYILRMLSC